MIRVHARGSQSGCTERQRATLRGLGLTPPRALGDLARYARDPGMIRKVEHVVRVEE
jgi:ribosomal protein L30/L7E